MKSLHIGIDIDGTLTPWRFYIDQLNLHFGMHIDPQEFTEYDNTEKFGLTDEMMEEFFLTKAEELHRTAPLRPMAGDILRRWQRHHHLYLITARRDWTHDTTLQWMQEQGILEIPLLTMGTSHKTPKALELKCSVFLEDHPKESLRLAGEGIQVLLMDAPYNRLCQHPKIHRIHDWKEADQALGRFLGTGGESV